MWSINGIFFLSLVNIYSANNCDCGRASDWIEINTRIYRGSEVQSFHFPWMAHLRFFDSTNGTRYGLCGGYLIDHRHIITAAHCVHDVGKKLRNINAIEVYLGIKDLMKLNRAHRVENVFYPNNYQQDSLYNDIAILRLKKRVKFNAKISPICLTDESITPNEILTVIGFGRLGPNKKPAQALMQVNVEYVDKERCNQMLRDYIIRNNPALKSKLKSIKIPQVHSSHMCAVDTYNGKWSQLIDAHNHRHCLLFKGGDACSGDSGGPLMYRNDQTDRYYAIGIVSGAMDECGDSRTPGFYTIVKNFKKFIQKVAPTASFCDLK